MRTRITRGSANKSTAENESNNERSTYRAENHNNNRREFSNSDRPARREFGSNDRPPRREFGDRPPRREFGSNDRPPRREFGSNDRPPRREFGDRPPRREFGSNDRPPRREFGDRPPRREFGSNDRPPRREFGDRPPRREFGSNDRPPRREFGDRPPRREFGSNDRPPRREYGDRPPRREFGSNDRPPRREFGDRPPRREFGSNDRPPRREYGDRPPRREFGSNDRPPRREFGSNDRPPRREFGDRPPRREFGSNDRPPHRDFHKRDADKYQPKLKGPKPVRKQEHNPDAVRLNKYIANSGVCSRREADEYILAGLVTVNGEVIQELGTKVNAGDDIRFNGERLKGEKKVYIIMNKPKDYVTTTSDPNADKNVMDLISKDLCPERVYPVGRLDKSTTGVLLFTNDGGLTESLTHPSYNRKKIYQVNLDKNLKKSDFEQLLTGIDLEDGTIAADALSYVDGDESVVGIEIHSGRNRIVRRMFEHLGYRVSKLDRVFFAGLTKKNLRRGQWRFLTDSEVTILKISKNG